MWINLKYLRVCMLLMGILWLLTMSGCENTDGQKAVQEAPPKPRMTGILWPEGAGYLKKAQNCPTSPHSDKKTFTSAEIEAVNDGRFILGEKTSMEYRAEKPLLIFPGATITYSCRKPYSYEIKDYNSDPCVLCYGITVKVDEYGQFVPLKYVPHSYDNVEKKLPDAKKIAQQKPKPVTQIKPPVLPLMPQDLIWPDFLKNDILAAAQNYTTDPVSACMTFFHRLNYYSSSIKDDRSRDWLSDAAKKLLPFAENILKQDQEAAIASGNVREVFIAQNILLRLIIESKGGGSKTAITIPKDFEDAINNKGKLPPVWRINILEVSKATEYSESAFGRTVRINAEKDSTLIRVKAELKNISDSSDPSYVLGIIHPILSSMNSPWEEFNAKDRISTPRRFASSNFFFLNVGHDWSLCSFVCSSSQTITKGGSVMDTRGENHFVSYAGSYVDQGETYYVDIIFTAPKDAKRLQFLVLGSPPIPITPAMGL